MFRHNLLITFRNLKRHKSTFFINLIGLSGGLACTFLIYIWVQDNLRFDKYHKNDSQLYQVMTNTEGEKGIETGRGTPHVLSEVAAQEIPEIEHIATTTPALFFPAFTLAANGKKVKGAAKFASKDFFKIFSYDLIQGSKSTALSGKSAIVLSESQAKILFKPTDHIVGQIVAWEVAGIKRACIVTGIFKDVPANSSEHFDFILSFDDLKDIMQMESAWGAEPFNTYLTIKKGVDADVFNRKLNAFIMANSKDENRSFFLTRYSDNYLYGTYENGKQTGGRIEYVRLFSWIALFILIISCVNFMNLSTAKAAGRIKEVGIKKAIGVSRSALIFQYMGESLLMSFLSLIFSVVLVYLLLPAFNEITNKNFQIGFDPQVFLAVLGITLFTGLLSGSYPALYLSGFKPATILKGKFSNSVAEELTRKGLVVFQFSLSIIFIVSVLVIYKQIEYVQNKNLGFDKNNVIYFESDFNEALLNDIRNAPGVEMASNMIGSLIGDKFEAQGGISHNGKRIAVHSYGVNYGMIETLGLKVKAGRSFLKNFGSGPAQIIINEAAVQALGLENPVGTILKGQGNDTEIIGVVNNFHFQSLHEKIEPVKFRLDTEGASTIVVKMMGGREKEAINHLKSIFKKFNTGIPFEYKFLDQDYQALYASEKQVSVLARYFAGLSILISCLGLYGLSAFTAETRLKEIGIRKVLGSSVFSIVRLLSSEFTKMICIAICISLPLSYFLAKNWLDDFAFRINLEWWYFFGAGATTMAIALLTVSFQSYRAALANPVKCLGK